MFTEKRTDLALERREMIGDTVPDGVDFDEQIEDGVKLTRIKITNENGAKALGKPIGNYITVEVGETCSELFEDDTALKILRNAIVELIGKGDRRVLVAGIGNEGITPDALGPAVSRRIFVTRHITDSLEKLGFGKLREVSAVSTGVLGQTGVETGEIIRAVVERVKPDLVIAVDALAAADFKRLGNTIQITDTGICPGSGVGNARKRLDKSSLGVRVVAVGVPTVTDASGFCSDNEDGETPALIVTPKDIDRIILDMSKLIAAAVNLSLHSSMSFKDILSIV